jgi:hypothetical protein
MLTVSEVTKAYGGKTLFEDVTTTFVRQPLRPDRSQRGNEVVHQIWPADRAR